MGYPKIVLSFDMELDQNIAWNFYNQPNCGGCDFWLERAIAHHCRLGDIEKSDNKKLFLDTYIKEYYDMHFDDMERISKVIGEDLSLLKDDFFKAVESVFSGYEWSQNVFEGYLSIFEFCPRFLSDGSFQVFLYDSKKMYLYTIFHEMLHFIFYDFAVKNFPETLGKMDKDSGFFWDIAEVFNVVMHHTDKLIALHGKMENIGYPEHLELTKKGMKVWQQTNDVKRWIEEMMK